MQPGNNLLLAAISRINKLTTHMQCGLSASESGLKLQEDLAALFDRQMTMKTVEAPETPEPSSPSSPVSPASSSQLSPITHSISQHYHHSSHVVRQAQTAEARERPSFFGTVPMTIGTDDILRSHNIDPSTLSPRQIELFEGAIPEQKSRLIQMWQICPETADPVPHTGKPAAGTCFFNSPYRASVEDHDMDDMVQDKDSDQDGQQYAEPYMVSGYEFLAQRDYEISSRQASLPSEPTTGAPYRLASDPIYQSKRWWEHTGPQPVEHQYGTFEFRQSMF